MSSPKWHHIQKENFRDWYTLVDFLKLDKRKRTSILQTANFPLNLPKRLAEKITKNSLEDPLLIQFVPLTKEKKQKRGFSFNPLFESSFQKRPNLLQKYRGRVLLTCSDMCAMHCRFCFRKLQSSRTKPFSFYPELEMIQKDTSIFEVILSGGDPLSLSDRKMGSLIQALENIAHIQILRIHTRFLIGIPERITDTFLHLLNKTRLQIFFVIHVNHPNELDTDVLQAVQKMRKQGKVILSQTVLLKGVNDSLETLKTLFQKFVQHGILPYYLHQLDKVEGASHFEVPIEKGKKLISALRNYLPGYAIPRYVQEIPYKKSKSLLY